MVGPNQHSDKITRENKSFELGPVVNLSVGAVGAGPLVRCVMNRRTTNTKLPRGPAANAAGLAGRRCRLGRPQNAAQREEGGRCLFVSMETNLGQTVCLGKGCEQHTSPSNQLESYAETAWLGLG